MLINVLIFISFVTLPATTRTFQNGLYSCSTSLLLDNLETFRCHNGSDCIDIKRVCDGVPDCIDASDETLCLYRNRRNYLQSEDEVLRRSKRQFSCRQDQVQCSNGSCVSESSECGNKPCVLPAYPDHGTYKVLDVPNAQPGQIMQYVVMIMSCDPGYDIKSFDNSVHYNETQEILCINGNWRPGKMPKCVSSCILESDSSVVYICQPPGAYSFQACDHKVQSGTVVKPQCNEPVYYSRKSLQNMNCRNGAWDYIAKCVPDCGRVTPEAMLLISNGRLARRGELPWHVGIYRKESKFYKQICGGSLVSNNAVISAAHCFWSDVEMLLPASRFAVAVGKLHRSWRSEQDKESQKSDVKDILILEQFQGSGSTLQADVAVLLLVTLFVYKPHIKPICLNFDKEFDSEQLRDGQIGKVAGWGLTTANGPQSKELNVVELPYISYKQCVRTVPQSFKQFITLDKFCAGRTNGTAVCHGDSGGGLVFPALDQDIERYYLRGIVSSAPRSDNQECNLDTYATFTRVSLYDKFITYAMQGRHLNWVPDIPIRETEPSLWSPESAVVDTEVAFIETSASCGVLPSATPEGIQYVPWHVGIYRKTTTPYKPVCSGTLINNKVVLSAGHCFFYDDSNVLDHPAEFAAAVGKIYRDWNNTRDVDAQISDIKEVKLARLLFGSITQFREAIAAVILITPFVYNTFVRPACLSFNKDFDRYQLQPGKYGKLTGWDLSSANESTSTLVVLDLPYIDLDICSRTYQIIVSLKGPHTENLPFLIKELIAGDKFCAGYDNGTRICKGMSGGGLAVPESVEGVDRYYLRGILTAVSTIDVECYVETYSTFTQIMKHEDFIKESVYMIAT